MGLIALAVATTSAVDLWETVGPSINDDTASSKNTLSHGAVQQHDLDEAGAGVDQDWMIVPTINRHSYEARLHANRGFSFGACANCSQFDRVNGAGAILTDDVSTVNEGPGIESYDRSIRWIASASTTEEFVRVTGDTIFQGGPNSLYTIRFWNTTYSVPRWNNANGQVTVFFINSMIQARAVLGELRARPADAPTAVSEGWLLGGLGELDAAFAVFSRAEEERQAFLYYVGLPAFDPFRDDSRYAAMLQRLGLPSRLA